MSRIRRAVFPTTEKQAIEMGARLRFARRRRGISMADMASRTLASRPTIARLENGNLTVSVAVLARYLDVLGLASDLDRIAEHDEPGAAIADERLGRPRRRRSRGLADEL